MDGDVRGDDDDDDYSERLDIEKALTREMSEL